MAAQYGIGLYMCVRDNVGDNPLRVPTRTWPTSWSIMSLLYDYANGSTAPSDALAQAAYDLAVSGTNIAWAAYDLAQIGTSTGSAAYSLAGSAIGVANAAISIANGAFSIAVAGTNAIASALSTANSAISIAVIGTNVGSEALSIASAAYAIAQIGTNTGTAALNVAVSGSSVAWQAYLIAVSGSNSSSDTSLINAAWELAQIGTNTGSTAYSLAQSGYVLAQIGTNTGSLAYSLAQSGYSIAQIGTNTGSTAYSIAQSGYTLSQIGTNTGTAAYNLAQQAYALALSASGSSAGTTALDAYHLAQIGTNTGTAAYSVAQSAWELAQIGTNTGTTAYSVAQAGYAIAQIGTNTGSTAYSIAQSAYSISSIGTNTGSTAYSTAQTAYSISQIGTNTGSTAYSVAQAAYALAQIGTNTAQSGTNNFVPMTGTTGMTGTFAYSNTHSGLGNGAFAIQITSSDLTLLSIGAGGSDYTMPTQYVAVKFTMPSTGVLGSVGISIKSAGAPITPATGVLATYIYSDSAGLPGSQVLTVSGFVPFGIVTTNYQSLKIRIESLSASTLVAGTSYWFVLLYSTPPSSSFVLKGDASSSDAATSSDGSSWSSSATRIAISLYSRSDHLININSDSSCGMQIHVVAASAFRAYSVSQLGIYGQSDSFIGVSGSSYWGAGIQGVSSLSNGAQFVGLVGAGFTAETNSGIGGRITGDGTMSGTNANHLLWLERLQSGTGQVQGDMIRLDDNPTCFARGAFIRGFAGGVERLRMSARPSDAAGVYAYLLDTDTTLVAGSILGLFNHGTFKAGVDANGRIITSGGGFLGGVTLNTSAGTAYPFTNSNAQVAFGTTNVTLTLTKAGTYLLVARIHVVMASATYSTSQNFNVHVERTNNTPSSLTQPAITFTMPIMSTTTSQSVFFGYLGLGTYTTANTNDILDLFASVTGLPNTGALNLASAQLMALQIS
jgi:hypothetical protein